MTKDNLPVPEHHNRRPTTWVHRRLNGAMLLSQEDIEMLNALRPRCAKCGKPVEFMQWRRAIAEDAVVFTVTCHGEKEETTIGFDQFPTLMLNGVQGAEAFAGPKLIEDESQ